MAAGDWLPIILSVPTSGAGSTAAATFTFATVGYRPPRQLRATASDTVKNQNGVTKHVYDNGPGPYEFPQFQVAIHPETERALGPVEDQWADLQFLWNYLEGPMGMQTPDGVYSVIWSPSALEPDFLRYPGAGDKLDLRVVVTFEEG